MEMFMNRLLKFIAILILCLVAETMAYEFQFKPFFLQIKDSNGQTLAEALSRVYYGKIRVDAKKGRCYFFQPEYRANDVEYEIDHCMLNYTQINIYSQADRLNGIELKGLAWIEGNSYRTRPIGGEWSRWRDSQMFSSSVWNPRTGLSFRKENGKFIFELGDNLKRIHDKLNQNSIFVPKAQSEPQKPPVKGYIDIRASGSGESSYYEERR